MTGALFAFLSASFRSAKWLISASRSTTHGCVFSLESYLLTLGILLHVPLMIAEVYYNMITLPYKGSLLEYKPCLNINPVPMGRDFVPLSVGLFKSTTLYAHIKLKVRWNRGSSING